MGSIITLPSDARRWRAPDDATVQDRLAWLEELGDRGAVDPMVRDFVERSSVVLVTGGKVDPLARVLALSHALSALCANDEADDGDYYQTARATLEDLHAECKAMVVFELAAARVLGVRARAVWLRLPRRFARWDHATAQLARGDDGPWSWADPLFIGARLGEHPEGAAERIAREEADRDGVGALRRP